MIQPFARILCNWQPSSLDAETIEREFASLLLSYGLQWDADSSLTAVTPERNRYLAVTEAGWHQDAHEGETPEAIVIWSDVLPTNIRELRTRINLHPQNNDVILIYNRNAEHRIPPEVEHCPNRWSIRAWITEMGETHDLIALHGNNLGNTIHQSIDVL